MSLSSINRLPLELLTAIVEHCDRKTTLSLCLVAKHLHAIAAPLVFRSIRLYDTSSVSKLSKNVEQVLSLPYAKFVESFRCRLPGDDGINFPGYISNIGTPILASLLHNFKRLKHLAILGIELSDALYKAASKLPHLESIEFTFDRIKYSKRTFAHLKRAKVELSYFFPDLLEEELHYAEPLNNFRTSCPKLKELTFGQYPSRRAGYWYGEDLKDINDMWDMMLGDASSNQNLEPIEELHLLHATLADLRDATLETYSSQLKYIRKMSMVLCDELASVEEHIPFFDRFGSCFANLEELVFETTHWWQNNAFCMQRFDLGALLEFAPLKRLSITSEYPYNEELILMIAASERSLECLELAANLFDHCDDEERKRYLGDVSEMGTTDAECLASKCPQLRELSLTTYITLEEQCNIAATFAAKLRNLRILRFIGASDQHLYISDPGWDNETGHHAPSTITHYKPNEETTPLLWKAVQTIIDSFYENGNFSIRYIAFERFAAEVNAETREIIWAKFIPIRPDPDVASLEKGPRPNACFDFDDMGDSGLNGWIFQRKRHRSFAMDWILASL